MNPLLALWLFLKASLFSTGGMGNLPSLHADLIPRGWATERQFAESLLIGQVAPGPNGLWVISLGYLSDGLRGALFALVAITLPPLLVLVIDRLYRRAQNHAAVEGYVRGLSLAVCGVSIVIMAQLFYNIGLDVRNIVIALVAIALTLTRRVPLLVILALAAIAGIVTG